MCSVLLPPGVYPIAVNKYINININMPTEPTAFFFKGPGIIPYELFHP
jgi:hypothetical protein